jgi:hypothetical protein
MSHLMYIWCTIYLCTVGGMHQGPGHVQGIHAGQAKGIEYWRTVPCCIPVRVLPDCIMGTGGHLGLHDPRSCRCTGLLLHTCRHADDMSAPAHGWLTGPFFARGGRWCKTSRRMSPQLCLQSW